MLVRIRISHGPRPPVRVTAGREQGATRPIIARAAVEDSIPAAPPRTAVGASSSVALGILASRITGLIRERVIGHYFGNSDVAGIFRAAFRIPNLLSNLFGEGVLSAAFVTVYAKLRAQEEHEEAEHLAAAIFGILAFVCSAIVLLGVLAAPFLVDVVAPGFKPEYRALTVRLVRILFPAAGVLVMSAWCLGVLNSHRKFLLSYSAPIAMNASMIAVLVLIGGYLPQQQAAIYLAWGSVVGSILQLLVQLPSVLQLLPHFQPLLDIRSQFVRIVIRNFGPVFLSRGVVQISAYVDQMIASFLGPVALAGLGYGQVIGILPVSLFSASVSAAELPALSSATGSQEEVAALLRRRLSGGLRRISFFIVPSAVAFLVIGDVLVAALYQGGRFHYSDAQYVWSVLAGSAVGLLATSLGRLYSSAFYSLQDTRTPLRFAVVRVALTTALGWFFALVLPRWLAIDPKWGVAGLTASAGLAGWVEFALLRHSLTERIGDIQIPQSFTVKLWAVAFIAAAVSYGLKAALGSPGTRHPIPLAALVVPLYGAIYFGGTALLRIPESKATFSAVFRRFTTRSVLR